MGVPARPHAVASRCRRDLQLLDVTFRIETSSPEPLERLNSLYASPEFQASQSEITPGSCSSLESLPPDDCWAEVDGSREILPPTVSGPTDLEEWAFTRLIDSSRRFLLVHAAALARKGRGVLVVGPTFAGKTTLAVGLAENGFEYYSDELAPIERRCGMLYPFRRAAAVRLGAGRRAFRQLGRPDGQHGERVPLPCRPGWVFILAGAQSPENASESQRWCLILPEDAEMAEQALRSASGITVASRSSWGRGTRLDFACSSAAAGSDLRRFVEEWSKRILYLGPAPRVPAEAFADEPSLWPLSREAAALEILRHTLNRRFGSRLCSAYGAHPNLKAYAEIFTALESAKCYGLKPGRPELTARLVRELTEREEPGRGAPIH